jgi:hypothetical protein
MASQKRPRTKTAPVLKSMAPLSRTGHVCVAAGNGIQWVASQTEWSSLHSWYGSVDQKLTNYKNRGSCGSCPCNTRVTGTAPAGLRYALFKRGAQSDWPETETPGCPDDVIVSAAFFVIIGHVTHPSPFPCPIPYRVWNGRDELQQSIPYRVWNGRDELQQSIPLEDLV